MAVSSQSHRSPKWKEGRRAEEWLSCTEKRKGWMGCVHMSPFQAIAMLGKKKHNSPISVNIASSRCLPRLFSFRRSVSEWWGTGGEGERRGRKAISTTESRGEGGRQRGRREETAAAIGFSLMLIERVTAVGDSHSVSLDAGVDQWSLE